MAQVVGRIVKDFQSLDYGLYNTGNHADEERRRLDTPRLLCNMLHTDKGSLWLPPAPTLMIDTVAGTGDIYKIVQTFDPGNTIVVQRGTTLSAYDIDGQGGQGGFPWTTADETFTLTDDEKCWALVYDSALYMGNSTQTVKLTKSGGVFTFTNLTGVPHGYQSMNYRNRRYVVERVFGTAGGTDQRLHYSDIGDAETYGADSFIDIEAYYEGDSWENALGSPVAAHPFSDVLALFLTQGIVRFTGTDPLTNFTLRPSTSQVGLWLRDTVSHIEPGILFFGGTPRGEFGVYLWRGNSSQLVSRQINGYLREWVEGTQIFSEDLGAATVWRNNYICALDVGESAGHPTIFVYNWIDQRWSTFDGWVRPTVALGRAGSDNLLIADGNGTDKVYWTRDPMVRKETTTQGRFLVGYEDEEQPSGWVRYLKVRLTVQAKAAGGTGIDVDLTATNTSGDSVGPITRSITTDGQHTLDFPLRFRGNAIDLDFTVSPSAADHELTVQNLELVQSRKGLKVARVGGE